MEKKGYFTESGMKVVIDNSSNCYEASNYKKSNFQIHSPRYTNAHSASKWMKYITKDFYNTILGKSKANQKLKKALQIFFFLMHKEMLRNCRSEILTSIPVDDTSRMNNYFENNIKKIIKISDSAIEINSCEIHNFRETAEKLGLEETCLGFLLIIREGLDLLIPGERNVKLILSTKDYTGVGIEKAIMI